MLNTSRRQVLLGSAASVAVLAAPGVAIASPRPRLPMWAVGSPGEFDWQAVAAPTRGEAVKEYLGLIGMREDDEFAGDFEVQRCAVWDDLDGEPSPADWLHANMGTLCDRCDCETHSEDGHAVGKEAVCEDCMTVEDWDIVDPEYAAELRADLAAEDDEIATVHALRNAWGRS